MYGIPDHLPNAIDVSAEAMWASEREGSWEGARDDQRATYRRRAEVVIDALELVQENQWSSLDSRYIQSWFRSPPKKMTLRPQERP